jgi:hypothetical protein
MLGSLNRLFVVSGLVFASAACNNDISSTKMQSARMDATKAHYGSHLTNMTDNAILRDMSVSDIHFIPHSAEISGVGEVRLSRMAHLLNTYGGIVRYETLAADEAMINQRVAHVREYLALSGCNMERVEITTGMAGGRGMAGDEAVGKFLMGTADDTGTSGQARQTARQKGSNSQSNTAASGVLSSQN